MEKKVELTLSLINSGTGRQVRQRDKHDKYRTMKWRQSGT